MSQYIASEISNENANIPQKDIFRLAALLYTETTDTFSSIDVQSYMVKCILAEDNDYMSIDDIISRILTNYKYHISEEELEKILIRPEEFIVQTSSGTKRYKLSQSECEKITEASSQNIEHYINQYIEIHGVSNVELFRDAVYKYIYELTTTNINSYKILLSSSDGSNFTDAELSVNADELCDTEKTYVNEFISWENAEKNLALSNLVFCCLEYCLLISGDKPNKFLSDMIRGREVFLDTNIIFRALGINGRSRKNVIIAFIKKCEQAKIKLIIGKPTRIEFWNTVDYYISQINEFPRGKVFVGAYESLAEYSLYSFYDEWYSNHENLSLKYFRGYVASLYADFVKAYKVHEESIPDQIFHADDFKAIKESYARGIITAKRQVKSVYISEDFLISSSDKHDASMIRFVELYRVNSLSDQEVFFVSSDKGLRYWDMTRQHQDYPVVIYPSQLFLILIKMCGRSENDLESFVHFINIRPRSQQLSAEKANVIISGISSITEDIRAQKSIVSMVLNEEFQNIIKHSNTDQELYLQAQLFSQRYLETDLGNKELEITNLTKSLLETDAANDELRSDAKQRDADLHEKQNQIELQREKICAFAERKIMPVHIVKWYILPFCIILYSLCVVLFVGFQFIYSNAPWNVVNDILSKIGETMFGKGVADYIYVIDAALVGLVYFLFTKIMVNPFKRNIKSSDKAEKVKSYIEKHQLL